MNVLSVIRAERQQDDDHRAREQRPVDHAREHPQRAGQQPDRDQQLEVALPDRPGPNGIAQEPQRHRHEDRDDRRDRQHAAGTSGLSPSRLTRNASGITGSVITSGSSRWSRSVARSSDSATT